MTAATPGQAAYEAVPEAYRRWLRIDQPKNWDGPSDSLVSELWHEKSDEQKEFWRSLDARQPHAARADEFARVKVRLSALVASLDETVKRGTRAEEFDQGAAHASAVTARQLREILNDTALGVTPQPAPGPAAAKPDLGTAWRLLNETREQLAALRDGIAELAADITASAAATRPSRKSQIEDECAIALRKLLEDQ